MARKKTIEERVDEALEMIAKDESLSKHKRELAKEMIKAKLPKAVKTSQDAI